MKHGGLVVVANIAPYKEDRAYNRKRISEYGKYVEVYVDTGLNECERRDVKGLYEGVRVGVIRNVTGINEEFEEGMSDVRLEGGELCEMVRVMMRELCMD